MKEKLEAIFREADKEMLIKNRTPNENKKKKYLTIKELAEENESVEEILWDDPDSPLKFHQILVYVKDLAEWEKESLKQLRKMFNAAEHVSIQYDKSTGRDRILLAFTVTIFKK